MKFFTCFSSRCLVVAPLLAASVSRLQAQDVDHFPGCSTESPVAPTPLRFVAKLIPVTGKSELSGDLNFEIIADVVNVTGHLAGLDPDKIYRLQLPSSRGIPGSHVRSAGVLRPDSSGKVTLKTHLKGLHAADGVSRIMGMPVILVKLQGGGVNGGAIRVANAVITLPARRDAPIQPSTLDELGPGERWF